MTEPTTSLPIVLDHLQTDRREFLRCTACGFASLAALSLVGCGGGDATTAPKSDTTTTVIKNDPTKTSTGDPKFEITGSQIKVFLSRVAELDSIPSFFLIERAETIVLRTGESTYLAFTAICTHEGCTVNQFSPGSRTMVCPCHGSEYDINGNPVAGPAPAPLKSFPMTFDAALKQLLITKSL